MIIQVKQKHIKNGIKSDPCNCPVALAIKERLSTEDVIVDDLGIGIGLYLETFRSTKKLESFIKNFDNGKKVKPFSFRLIKETV